jgi:hypothetical protein
MRNSPGIIYTKANEELKQLDSNRRRSRMRQRPNRAPTMCRYWLDTYGSELEPFLKIVANGELKTAVLSV